VRYLNADIVADCAYLIPIGDIHIGDKAFGKKGRDKLRGYINWVKERPNARIFIMGDVFNVASRTSKTSPFESNPDEYLEADGLFKPVAKQIIGAIDGNHEARMIDMFGYSPLQAFCSRLGVPYCGWSAVVELNVGNTSKGDKRARTVKGRYRWNTYHVYCHHTTGGGGSLGGALNRSVKLQELVQGIDVYCGGHNHQLVTGVRSVMMPYPPGHRMVERKITYVDCGSYLDWDESYAERGMMPQGKLGSPRIRFSGFRNTRDANYAGAQADSRDVHVSL
jgi:hypothetical protein